MRLCTLVSSNLKLLRRARACVFGACSSLVLSWQVLIGTDSITNLHKLEQVSSDEGIGTLAENLLEALREHPDVNKKIDAARRETRAEKKRMAMAMRQKALGTLGMTVPPARGPYLLTRGFRSWGRACEDAGWEVGGGGVRGAMPDTLLRDVTVTALLCAAEARRLRFRDFSNGDGCCKILFKPLMWVCEVDVTPIVQMS